MIILSGILDYLYLGFTHVIPLGWDHILFILCLFFLNDRIKIVVLQCSIFTIAHSLSLGLTAAGIIFPNTNYIEVLIAASILFTAVENILYRKLNPFRLTFVFIFGLIHGMGFASALKDIGIPKEHFFSVLFSFNLGVELGQISVILIAYFTISKWFSKKNWYLERIVYPVSSIIACISLYWTIERLF